MIVLGTVLGLFLLLGAVLLLLPWRLAVRWRKPWSGPFAIAANLSIGTRVCKRTRWSPRLSLMRRCSKPLQWRRVQLGLDLLHALSPAIAIEACSLKAEIGFDDPSLTGQCLVLLSSLPPSLQRSLCVTFERVGFCSRGFACLRLRPIALLCPLAKWVWTKRRSLVAWMY
ncbi:hypothetical protein [Synechococcus sp. PCC 7336]|uniref:hypothetical protein n=1 Tax=Synechococcus sp. PCC 7336 TaxID=195250 RepID=UPI000345CE67|nr:hypothetical protein [Synechococcus sp. PCC 7336]